MSFAIPGSAGTALQLLVGVQLAGARYGQSSPGMIPLNIFGRQLQQPLLIDAAYCRKKGLHSLDILFDAHRISLPLHDSSVELDQVLEDQMTPFIPARLHK